MTGESAHSARTDDEQHHGVCPLCARVITRSDIDELGSIIANHNEQRHGGEEVARLVGSSTDELNELMDEARGNYDRQTYRELVNCVLKSDVWGFNT